MSNVVPDNDQELQQLIAQNHELQNELGKLRSFIDNMDKLALSMDKHYEEAHLHLLLAQVLTMAGNAVHARDASLLVVDEDTNDLVFILSRGSLKADALAWQRIPAGAGIAGWVVANKRATIVNHARSDERFYAAFDAKNEFRTESVLAAPIISGERVLGVIEVLNKTDGRLFSAQEQSMLSLACYFAGQLLQALTRRTLQAARIPPSRQKKKKRQRQTVTTTAADTPSQPQTTDSHSPAPAEQRPSDPPAASTSQDLRKAPTK